MKTGALQSFLHDTTPADLGPGPRAGVTPLADLNGALNDAFASAHLAGTQADLIRATLLLWHDHHDAAHRIVQDMETPDGSYIHAILHRREPDYFNAKYWFRRVGQHPCFNELTVRAADILRKSNQNRSSIRYFHTGNGIHSPSWTRAKPQLHHRHRRTKRCVKSSRRSLKFCSITSTADDAAEDEWHPDAPAAKSPANSHSAMDNSGPCR